MEEDLRAYLLSQSGVTSQVSTRVYWGERPQSGALPAVVMQVISDLPSYSMEGDNDLNRTRVQLDVYGSTYGAAKTAARAVKTALNSYQGTTGGTSFRGVFRDGERDDRIAGTNEADRFFRVSLDYLVFHKSA